MPSSVSAIATIPAGDDIMTAQIALALTQAAQRVRRAITGLAARFTRSADIKFTITVSLPPFFTVVLIYKADIGELANDNTPRQVDHSA
jgi:hypothetical protein